jgi:hypothetical protein
MIASPSLSAAPVSMQIGFAVQLKNLKQHNSKTVVKTSFKNGVLLLKSAAVEKIYVFLQKGHSKTAKCRRKLGHTPRLILNHLGRKV